MLTLPATPHFPYNLVDIIVQALQEIDPHTDPNGFDNGGRDGIRIYKRRLRETDATESLGVFPTVWDPAEDSVEMRGDAVPRSTVQRYPINVQSYVESMDEDHGIAMHSYLASLIRDVLHESEVLEALLPTIRVRLLNKTESVLRYGVTSQSLIGGQMESGRRAGYFGYLSTTEFYVDTQIN